jgi:hypothetical protein
VSVVLEVAVNRAILHHQDLAIALENGGLDSPTFSLRRTLTSFLPSESLTRLAGADRAQRVGLARPAERRPVLVRLQERLIGPLRRERRVLGDLVQVAEQKQAPLAVIDRPFSEIDGRVLQ